MARPLRLEFPGALYHITSRGNARQDIFLDRHDREAFLALLSREIGQRLWKCHAYCLMTNHYHLLIETPGANLVGGMKRLNGCYCQRFNRRHGRVGHVLQGRYHALIVDRDAYLLELARYIVLNPVRAGMAETPGAWRWSSYRATAGTTACPAWMRVDDLLGHFGRTSRTARAAYRRFVAQGRGALGPWDLVRGGIWLGREEFLERMESLSQERSLDNVPILQTRPNRPDARRILEEVAGTYRTVPAAILARRYPLAFRAAVYLWRRGTGLTLREISALTGVTGSWISKIDRRMEGEGRDGRLRALEAKFKVKN